MKGQVRTHYITVRGGDRKLGCQETGLGHIRPIVHLWFFPSLWLGVDTVSCSYLNTTNMRSDWLSPYLTDATPCSWTPEYSKSTTLNKYMKCMQT